MIGHFLDRGNELQAIQSVFVGASCKGKEIICTGIDGGICLCHGEDEGDSGVNAALVQLLTENKCVFGKVQFYDDFRADFGKKLCLCSHFFQSSFHHFCTEERELKGSIFFYKLIEILLIFQVHGWIRGNAAGAHVQSFLYLFVIGCIDDVTHVRVLLFFDSSSIIRTERMVQLCLCHVLATSIWKEVTTMRGLCRIAFYSKNSYTFLRRRRYKICLIIVSLQEYISEQED